MKFNCIIGAASLKIIGDN